MSFRLYPPYVKSRVVKPIVPVVPKEIVNKVSVPTTRIQTSVAGAGANIPLVYGRKTVGAKVVVLKASGGYIYVSAVWAIGECESIDSIIFDGKTASASNVIQHYLGTIDQIVDPTLALYISGYNDKNIIVKNGIQLGVCYSVLKVLAKNFPSNISAIIKGKKVYDPRLDSISYSANPSLCLADFITNGSYGQGKLVDWDSVGEAADSNDELVVSSPRRTLNLSIEKKAKTISYVETLRAYAGCFIIQEEVVYLVPNRPAAVSRSILAKDILEGSLTIKKLGIANVPNKATIVYSATAAVSYDREVSYTRSGTEGELETVVQMQGITNTAQASREAEERVKSFIYSDLNITWISFDESLQDQIGDIVEVTHPRGLTAKPFRILGVEQSDIGRFRITAVEYNSQIYADTEHTENENPDTDIPSPSDPPTPDNLLVSEELFQQGTGTYSSRLRISWDSANIPFLEYYRVVVKVASEIIFEINTVNTECTTSSVLELLQHDVEVYTYSGIAYSTPAIDSIEPLGKYLPPNDVETLNGFEAGGTVFLEWAQVIDIDMWKYEIKYGVADVTWEDALLLDRIDALRLRSDGIPAGDWDFLIKAVDSVGNYSDIAKRKSITVTLDNDAFLVGNNEFIDQTYISMHEYKLDRTEDLTHAVSESTDTWDLLFPATMDSYVNSIHSYQGDIVSEYLTEVWDTELQLSGDWIANIDYTVISGSVVSTLELSTDEVSWDAYTNLSAKTTARYVRIRIKSDTGLFSVYWPHITASINAIPRAETGQSTSLISGGVSISLSSDFAKVKSVTITPLGSSAINYSVDNIDLDSDPNTFDVFLFDDTGDQIINDFLYKFEGV